MASELIGKQAKLTFTPGSSGADIVSSEGVVTSFTRIVNSEDFTPLGQDEEESCDLGFASRLTLRCRVNNSTGSTNGNPQLPNGVMGTITVYKNKGDTSHGSWNFQVRVTRMTLVANARGHTPQHVDWIMVQNGGITETR